MENRITEPGAVLNKQGEILPGYSTGSILSYHRKDIKAPFYRIKNGIFIKFLTAKNACNSPMGMRLMQGKYA
ncbi:MAG: hypothetical protein RSA78_07830 [Oscillospiraceae bacterium]